jgi:hypothetical protein
MLGFFIGIKRRKDSKVFRENSSYFKWAILNMIFIVVFGILCAYLNTFRIFDVL